MLISVPCFKAGNTLLAEFCSPCQRRFKPGVEAYCYRTSIVSSGKRQDTVAYFVFILFLQTSCMMTGG